MNDLENITLEEHLMQKKEKIDDCKSAMVFMEQYSVFLISKLENLEKYLEEDGCEELHADYIETIKETQRFIQDIWGTYKSQAEQIPSWIELVKGYEKELRSNKEITILFRLILLFLIIFTVFFYFEIK